MYTDDNLLGESINTIKRNKETLSDTCKKFVQNQTQKKLSIKSHLINGIYDKTII